MRVVVLIALAASICGCIDEELLASHVMAGGVVSAAITGGPTHAATGLGDGTKEPFSLTGFSAELTFGLVAAADSAGQSVITDIAVAEASVEIPIAPGQNQLEIHLDGSGCTAVSGSMSLTTDENKNLTGTFSATGTVPGQTAACSFSGTLTAVPVMR